MKIYLYFLLIILLSCKTKEEGLQHTIAEKTVVEEVPKNSLKAYFLTLDKSQAITLPYGTEALKYHFENRNEANTTFDNESTIKNWNDSISNFISIDSISKNRKNGVVSYSESKKVLNDQFTLADTLQTIQFKGSKVNISDSFNTYSLLSKEYLACENCELPEICYQNMLITTNKNHVVQDVLCLSYKVGSDYGYKSQYFTIDSNKIIHLKTFYEGELEFQFLDYKMYQITKTGNFIRYFKNNGKYSVPNESGMVTNNTKEGIWIEILKSNKIENLNLPDNYIYLEANYTNGRPSGKFNYFKLDQEYDEDGLPIIASRKRANLIFTEVYDDGKLMERKFVK